MKILFINGESDSYTAMTIEDDIGIENFVKEVELHGGKLKFDDMDREIFGEAEIIEYENVDKDFIKFIRNNFIDYDEAKHRDFYVLA